MTTPTVAPAGLVFRAEDHTYHFRGRQLPSVTTLCRPLMPDYSFADPALGTLVHTLTAHYDMGLCVLQAPAVPYVEAWIRFRQEMDFVPELIEQVCGDPHFGYAGTVDRVGAMRRQQVLLDIKTGDPDPWHGVQLAGYSLALGLGCPRYGVYLSGDGTYRLREYTSRADFDCFRALLTVHNWSARNA